MARRPRGLSVVQNDRIVAQADMDSHHLTYNVSEACQMLYAVGLYMCLQASYLQAVFECKWSGGHSYKFSLLGHPMKLSTLTW